MKFALFIAAASAASINFKDKCTTDAQCPKFFNEQMKCATWTETYAPWGYKMVGKDCAVRAMCGWHSTFGEPGYNLSAACTGKVAEAVETTEEIKEFHGAHQKAKFAMQKSQFMI
jgi:hypothetical protein